MAKGNLFLGYASGKLGSVVMYHSKGAQVSRALNPSPSNPQSALQMLQRVTMKTSSLAYSLLQDICNHAFEGYAAGTPSQSVFVARNVALMRLQLADYINSGDVQEILGCLEANFNAKTDAYPAFRPYLVSDGRAPQIKYSLGQVEPGAASISLDYEFDDIPSYDVLINRMGLSRGDQLTFLFLSVNDTDVTHTFNNFYYARVILDPANGDFTTPFCDENGDIQSPNPRNNGGLRVYPVKNEDDNTLLMFDASVNGRIVVSRLAGKVNSLGAAGVIVSRRVGNTWQRSKCQLLVRSSVQSDPQHLTWDHEDGYLSDAIASYIKSGAVSTAYLNQAQKVAATKD